MSISTCNLKMIELIESKMKEIDYDEENGLFTVTASNLIDDKVYDEEFDYVKALVDYEIEDVDIRITVGR